MIARSIPEEVFKTAQEAMERRDLHTFFATLDDEDLKDILEGAIANSYSFLGVRSHFKSIYEKHSFPIKNIAKANRRIAGSATLQIFSSSSSKKGASDNHYKSVLDYDSLINKAADNVENLAGLVADLEACCWEKHNFGNIAFDLFVGETLKDVAIEGDVANAMRQITDTFSDSIKFHKKDDGWYIRFLDLEAMEDEYCIDDEFALE